VFILMVYVEFCSSASCDRRRIRPQLG
jgi:hypothetical protein